MGKLLRFEFYKMIRSKSFLIISGVAVISCIIMLITMELRGADGYTSFTALIKAVDNSGVSMLFGIFGAIFICDDYSGGTIRLIVARGFSRTQIYFAKLIAFLAGSLIMLVASWFISIVTGAILWRSGGSISVSSLVRLLWAQTILLIAYVAVYSAVCSAIQKTGVSVAVCIVAPMVIVLILNFLQLSVLKDSVKDIVLDKYWIDNMITSVGVPEATDETVDLAIKGGCVYLLIGLVSGWLATFKREY